VEWIDEILPDEAVRGAAVRRPARVDHRRRSPASQMDFQPLLPDDEHALDARVEALGAWCQGFLYGFGAAAPRTAMRCPRRRRGAR